MPSSNVLIVEDETFLAELYAIELTAHKVSVSLASDGRTALELLKRKKFSVILLDILLPDMNGLQVMEEAYKISSKLPPVVVLSNLGQGIPRPLWKKFNVVAHLVKSDVLAGAVWKEIVKYTS